jgi:hypothetical protein
VVKSLLSFLALAAACAIAVFFSLSPGTLWAQERDPLISPSSGGAGSRFQIVGETGWTPGETVTISIGFSDIDPGEQYGGTLYHERQVVVLRDGTWSFPIVVNQDLVPFPLWRPGFIVVKATSPTHTAVNSFVYTVEGRAPLGAPPLASLGFGPEAPSGTAAVTLALFAAATGALVIASGGIRRKISADYVYSRPISRKKASMFGSRPRKLRTSSSPSTLPPRSRILRR